MGWGVGVGVRVSIGGVGCGVGVRVSIGGVGCGCGGEGEYWWGGVWVWG